MYVKLGKILRVSLLGAVLAAALCGSAFALTEGNFQYTLSNNEAHVTGLVEFTETVNVPDKLGGVPVVSIDHDAMNRMFQSPKIVNVTLPDTVRVIGERAFHGCKNLRSIKMPASVEEIGLMAFEGCESLTSIRLPDSVKTIGVQIFRDCSSLSDVRLPSQLEEIPANAFSGCSSLRSISFPASVKVIGECSFASSGLTSVTIPAGVTMEESVFWNCASLAEVNLPAGLTKIPRGSFYGCTSLRSLYIPASVTSIGSETFDKTALEELILPCNVKGLVFDAFNYCDNLKAIYAPSGAEVSMVPDNCIVYCTEGSKTEAQCKKHGDSYIIDPSVDSQIHVVYNGRRISFGATGQNPVVESGRTLVPLRAIFEAMGATVGWDDATKTVTATRGGDTIKLTLGDKTLYKNGKAVMTLDVPAKSLNGRTVVPARAVAEAFGADVGWIAAAKIVTIDE
ncbi:MAG: leucine-rich repeat protein [Butyricicoccus sp.]